MMADRDAQQTLIRGLLLVSGGYLVYRLGRSFLADVNKNAAQRQADDDPAVRQAMTLKSAMNPSSIAWLMPVDGTNEKMILDIAAQITNLDAVSKAYRNLYQRNLLEDLQSELSTRDFQQFLTLVASNTNKQTKPGSSPATPFAQPLSMIVVKKDVFIRSSPDASYHGAIYEQLSPKNIIRTARVGEFLGFATGKQHLDTKNNVKFIEVGFAVKAESAPVEWKTRGKQKITYWVSSSANYIAQYKFLSDMIRAYPAIQQQYNWMKPLTYYDGQLKGVIATNHVAVFDEAFRPVGGAQPSMLLGVLETELHTGTDVYYQFRTPAAQPRWVNGRYAKIINL